MKKIIEKYQELSLQVKAAVWYMICNILQKGISLIAVPLYTRILTTTQYGAYSVFVSWLEIFEIIATFRLSWGGYVVGLTKYEDDRKRYTSSIQCLSLTLTTVVFLIYLCFQRWINLFTGMTTAMTCMIFVLLYTMPATSFWMARKRVEYKYTAAVILSLSSSILIPCLGIFSALYTVKSEYAIIGARVLIQGIIGVVMIFVNCHSQFTFFNKRYWRRSLGFNGPLIPYYLSMVLLHSSDRIIIQRLIGQAQAGIYSVAYSASMVMQLFNSAITSSMQPWLYKRMKDEQYSGISKVINASLIAVAGLNLLLMAFAPEIIAIMAPSEYQEAIWVVPPLAGSVFVMFFYQHFVNIEFYFEESRLTAFASVGAAGLNLVLNFLFIPLAGYLVAGYTTLVSYLLFAVVHYLMMKKVCKKHKCPCNIVDIRRMIQIMIAFLGISCLLVIGYMHTIIRYSVVIIICIAAYLFRERILFMIRSIKKDSSL